MHIEQSIGTYPGETTELHRFFAIDESRTVGELYIDIDRLIIMQVEVVADRQREGIATALYRAAVDALPAVYHAPEQARTEDGDGFARAVGGDAAEWMDELGELVDYSYDEAA